MTFPLSRKEKKLLKGLSGKVCNGEIHFSQAEYQQYKEIIEEMARRDIILDSRGLADIDYVYLVLGDIDAFVDAMLSQSQKTKSLSRREWKIAIISAVVGALVGQISDFIQWLCGK